MLLFCETPTKSFKYGQELIEQLPCAAINVIARGFDSESGKAAKCILHGDLGFVTYLIRGTYAIALQGPSLFLVCILYLYIHVQYMQAGF